MLLYLYIDISQEMVQLNIMHSLFSEMGTAGTLITELAFCRQTDYVLHTVGR